jgi:hypothetical protein
MHAQGATTTRRVETLKRIEWLTGEDEVMEQAGKTGRAILLDFFKPT